VGERNLKNSANVMILAHRGEGGETPAHDAHHAGATLHPPETARIFIAPLTQQAFIIFTTVSFKHSGANQSCGFAASGDDILTPKQDVFRYQRKRNTLQNIKQLVDFDRLLTMNMVHCPANLQTCKPANLQTCKPANLQTCKPANLQTCKPANLNSASAGVSA
jgi:hypothetical protein